MSSAETLTAPATGSGSCVFRRVLLVHTAEEPEIDLLDYAAKLSAEQTTIAAYPFDGILRSMAAAARLRFEAAGSAAPVLCALPEMDLDWILDAAKDFDLLILRPAAFGKRTNRQVFAKSPCHVCLVPQRTAARIQRILIGITLDDAGHALLEGAASLCHTVQANELLAVHCASPDPYIDWNDTQLEQFRSAHMLELYRFMARAKLDHVSCTPVLEEAIDHARALARVARSRSADLVVVGKPRGLAPRVAPALAKNGSAPVIQLLLPPRKEGVRGTLKRLFPRSQPKFS